MQKHSGRIDYPDQSRRSTRLKQTPRPGEHRFDRYAIGVTLSLEHPGANLFEGVTQDFCKNNARSSSQDLVSLRRLKKRRHDWQARKIDLVRLTHRLCSTKTLSSPT